MNSANETTSPTAQVDDWLSFNNEDVSFRYPQTATVFTEGYHTVSGSLSINRPSSVLGEFDEIFTLSKNVATQSVSDLKEYARTMLGPDHAIESLTIGDRDVYQQILLTPTEVYLGTFFQDEAMNYYYFYIEQTAPTSIPPGSYTATFSQEYLDELRTTYDGILKSIQFVR